MAFVHCHKCHWSQDDFWDWKWRGILSFWKWKHRPFGYNPFSLILQDIAEYWKPRRISFDSYAAKDMGFKNSRIFSWDMLLYNMKRHAKRVFTQRWWTYTQWEKDLDNNIASCPKCDRSEDLDID